MKGAKRLHMSEVEKREDMLTDVLGDSPLDICRHSTSHVMAQAVKDLFPEAKVTIGPSIANGFYYDFDVSEPFTPGDIEKIENRMNEIIEDDHPFVREELSKNKAIQLFKERNEPYKVEIIEELDSEVVSIYRQGPFLDLCRGPHLESTGKIKSFKILSTAGSYWRGDEKNPQLQRIYGTAFLNRKDLKKYLLQLEEAKKRDHRKIGKELSFYSTHLESGPGLIFWHPHSSRIRHIIETFWKDEHLNRGYQLLYTPHISKLNLWKVSGHWDNYQENMFSPMKIDDEEYIVKPMNCPGHIMIYNSDLKSYRDLPVRYAELGTVYRYERTGVLHGMMRVRGFTQDDAHIFCSLEQVKSEIENVIQFIQHMMSVFGFETKYYLSTRPEKYVGSDENWSIATESLKSALETVKIPYEIDPGEGVFYGPKIDVKLIDALERGWQGPTIQVDFNLPQKFDVKYIGKDGAEHHAVMIHRTVLGSMERFMGILIEQYAGTFPVWLAPVQVKVLPIADEQIAYCQNILSELSSYGIRTELDKRNEKIGQKIRNAQLEKIPYMLIIGKKEVENKSISIRHRKKGDLGSFSLNEFRDKMLNLNAAKSLQEED